ncbi:MAG TPA: hypothetical protein VK179_19570 [Bacteroidales bacterium]|nr:hypothetical protein [Bacteroidales bacterium]
MNYSGSTIIYNTDDHAKILIIDRANPSSNYTHVEFAYDSIVLDYPENKKKFDVVRPCGLSFSLVSTHSQFYDFYTPLMFRWNVIMYINGILIFEGWLNTETFSENYSKQLYTVRFVANNGFTLLKRLSYTGGTNQLIPVFNVIKDCIDAMNYNAIQFLYVGISTTSPHVFPDSSETLFHDELINSYNFYDENGEPQALYGVLEDTLKPYTANIRMKDGGLYITDHNMTLSGNVTYKKFDIQNNYMYAGTSVQSTNLGELPSGLTSEMQLQIVPAYNKAKVKFSPYANTKAIDTTVKVQNQPFLSGVTKSSDGNWGFDYNYYQNTGSAFTLYNAKLATVQGTGAKNQEKSEDVIIISGNNTGQTACSFNSQTYLVNHNYSLLDAYKKYYIKISITAMFRTQDSYKKTDVNTNEIVTNSHLNCGFLACKLKLGDQWFTKTTHWEPTYPGSNGIWSETENLLWIPFFQKQVVDLPIGETDTVSGSYRYEDNQLVVSAGLYVPMFYGMYSLIPFHVSGQLQFSILNAFAGIEWNNDDPYGDPMTSIIKDVWVKRVDIEIVDKYGNTVPDQDYEKIAYFDPLYENEHPETTLNIGDSIVRNPSERGAIFYQTHNYFFNFDYVDFSTGHTKQGLTSSMQNLYLRSVLSNYRLPSIQLDGVFVNNLVNPIGYHTNNHDPKFAGKKLMISGVKQYIFSNRSEVTLIEMNQDDQTITEI